MSKLVLKYLVPSGPLVGKNALLVKFNSGLAYPGIGPALAAATLASIRGAGNNRGGRYRDIVNSEAFQKLVRADALRRINQILTAPSDATSTSGTRLAANSKTIVKLNKRLDEANERNRTDAKGAELLENSKQESKDFYNSPEYLARLRSALPSYEVRPALYDINNLVDNATGEVLDNRMLNYMADGVASDDDNYYGLYTWPIKITDDEYDRYYMEPPQIYLNRALIDDPVLQATATHELSHWTEQLYDPALRKWNELLLNGALDPNADEYYRDPSEVRARAMPIWVRWRKERDSYNGDIMSFLRNHYEDPEIGHSVRDLLGTFKTKKDLKNYLENFVQADKPNSDNYSITPEYKLYYT